MGSRDNVQALMLRIDLDIHEVLKGVAARRNVSMNTLINGILARHLADATQGKGPEAEAQKAAEEGFENAVQRLAARAQEIVAMSNITKRPSADVE